MKKHIEKGDSCLNCDHPLDGENFCPECGQLNNTAKPTLYHLIMDALSNLFAFDSKFYLSIWPLLRRPGILSLEVIQGKRVRYLPPIRLFLLITVIMLGLNSLTERVSRSWNDVEHLKKNDKPMFVANADSSKGDNDLQLTFDASNYGQQLSTMYRHALKNPNQSLDSAFVELNLEDTFINTFFYSSFLKLANMTSDQFMSYINSNLLFILLLFIPILAFILKALYFYKKDYYYVDHFIFSLHTQTAFFVFITVQIVLSWFFNDWALLLILVGFPIYLFKAMRNFYKQSRFLTFVNFVIVNSSFVIVSIVFLVFVSLVSFILI